MLEQECWTWAPVGLPHSSASQSGHFVFGPEEHPRIPHRQTDFLTSMPLDPGADVASCLGPQWDVWIESLLRMSQTWNAAAAVAPCKQRNVLYRCSAALLQAVYGGFRK